MWHSKKHNTSSVNLQTDPVHVPDKVCSQFAVVGANGQRHQHLHLGICEPAGLLDLGQRDCEHLLETRSTVPKGMNASKRKL